MLPRLRLWLIGFGCLCRLFGVVVDVWLFGGCGAGDVFYDVVLIVLCEFVSFVLHVLGFVIVLLDAFDVCMAFGVGFGLLYFLWGVCCVVAGGLG